MRKLIFFAALLLTLSSCGSLLHYSDAHTAVTVDSRDSRSRYVDRPVYIDSRSQFARNYRYYHGYTPARVITRRRVVYRNPPPAYCPPPRRTQRQERKPIRRTSRRSGN